MANATIDDVTAAVLPADLPAYEAIDADVITEMLAQVALIVGAPFGASQAKAQAMLVLHFLAPIFGGGVESSGVIASEANGPASRSFAVPALTMSADEGLFASSYYGRRFLLFRRVTMAKAACIVGNPGVLIP